MTWINVSIIVPVCALSYKGPYFCKMKNRAYSALIRLQRDPITDKIINRALGGV